MRPLEGLLIILPFVNLLFEIIFFPKKLLNVFPCLVELVKVKPIRGMANNNYFEKRPFLKLNFMYSFV